MSARSLERRGSTEVKFQLRKCRGCGRYTLKGECPECGGETRSAHPAKFSPDDKYMRYRLAERYQDDGA